MNLKILLTGLGASGLLLAGVTFWPPVQSRSTVFRLERLLSPEQLHSEADLVLVGVLKNARTYTDRSTGEPVVLTQWTVNPTRILKGEPHNSLTVTLTGGVDGSVEFRNTDLPTLKSGQRVLWYLREVPEKKTFIPLSLRQGVFTEKNGKFISLEGTESPASAQ